MRDTWCLFLDLDGTVLDIAAKPSDVQTEPQLIDTLRQLDDRLDGALAIVSGRPVADIDHLLAPLTFATAGIHGCEMRLQASGPVRQTLPPVSSRDVALLKDKLGDIKGVVIEEKGCAVAVHYRNAPAALPMIEALVRQMSRQQPGLAIVHGRMAVELIPRGVTKLTAISELREWGPFRGRRPIVIGDDATDQAAIDAAAGWGGLGLRVAGEHFPMAQSQFPGPATVRAWLASFAEQLPRRRFAAKMAS